MRSERAPTRRRRFRRLHGSVDVGGAALSDAGELLSGRWIERIEECTRCRRLPFAVDEMSEAAFVTIKPRPGLFRILRRGAVFHADEFFRDTHRSRLLAQNTYAIGWR